MVLYIILIVVAIIINIAFSNHFADCAEEKGYTRSNYFWLCFFFGVAGYCAVAALPDAALNDKISRLLYQMEKSSNVSDNTQHTADAQIQAGEWRCSCGRVHPTYVSTCVCGINRNQIK